jgi:hypothetical protein
MKTHKEKRREVSALSLRIFGYQDWEKGRITKKLRGMMEGGNQETVL